MGKHSREGLPDASHIHVFSIELGVTYSGRTRVTKRQCSCGKKTTEFDLLSQEEIDHLKYR